MVSHVFNMHPGLYAFQELWKPQACNLQNDEANYFLLSLWFFFFIFTFKLEKFWTFYKGLCLSSFLHLRFLIPFMCSYLVKRLYNGDYHLNRDTN